MPVSTVGVLYMTYPVFTLLIGWIWFRAVLSNRAMTGAKMVMPYQAQKEAANKRLSDTWL